MGQKFSLSPSSMMKSPSKRRKQTVTYNPLTQRTKRHKKNKHKIVLVGINGARDCPSK